MATPDDEFEEEYEWTYQALMAAASHDLAYVRDEIEYPDECDGLSAANAGTEPASSAISEAMHLVSDEALRVRLREIYGQLLEYDSLLRSCELNEPVPFGPELAVEIEKLMDYFDEQALRTDITETVMVPVLE